MNFHLCTILNTVMKSVVILPSPGVTPSSSYYRVWLPQFHLVHLAPEVKPCVVLYGVWAPPALGCECM